MNKVKKITCLFLNLLLFGLANIIPKSNKIWVFGAWFGQKYSDNPRAFFEYINHNQPDVEAVWITKNKTILPQIRSKGFKAYYYLSLKGLWIQLRANYVVLCQSLHDDLYAPSIGRQSKIIQLWHGIPLKKIMFDVFGDRQNNKNFVGNFFDYLSPYNQHKNDCVVATSELTQNILSTAFRVPLEKTFITGFPRNDVFFDSVKQRHNSKLLKCIYMPTFRGGIGTECDLFNQYGFDLAAIELAFIENNIQLTLRMHPVNKPPKELIESLKHSQVIILDDGQDIYDTIADYDCLITDYSSIYFDFILSDKPIIFAPFDLEQYKEKERALYFNFPEVTLKPYCMNWSEITSRLIEIKNNGLSNEYISAYQELKTRFHREKSDSVQSYSEELYKKITKTFKVN